MGPDGADAAAAVPQEPQAEVGTLLRFLFKQELGELQRNNTTDSCRRSFRHMFIQPDEGICECSPGTGRMFKR